VADEDEVAVTSQWIHAQIETIVLVTMIKIVVYQVDHKQTETVQLQKAEQ
jgi:hypothetical protein